MDIVFLIIFTAVIIFKLKSVLGTRNDNDNIRQKTLEEFFKNKIDEANKVKTSQQTNNAQIIDITDQITKNNKSTEFKLNIDVADNVKKELEKINFNEDKFLKGAENAVEMINDSFSNKDLETLKELLTTQVYNNFKKQIDELSNQNRILKSSLISFLSNKIDNIVVKNKNINIDVLFEMEQINFVEDKDGNIIMGSKKKIQKVKEKWTFEKKTGDKTNFWLIKNIENITK